MDQKSLLKETTEFAESALRRLKALSNTIIPYERKKQSGVSRTELTPVHFLIRSASIYPHKIAVKHNTVVWTYKEFEERVLKLSYRLLQLGVKPGDRVGFLCKNIPALLEAHFALPAIRAIIVPINFRLGEREIKKVVKDSALKILFYETQYLPTLSKPKVKTISNFCVLIPLNDEINVYKPYTQFLKETWNDLSWDHLPYNKGTEEDIISLNYTSGTTGVPKGVMYTYRGVCLNILNIIMTVNLNTTSTYLWTLPLSHCNGWCFSWAVIAAGGTNIMMPKINYDLVWFSIKNNQVTHYCATPTIQEMIIENAQAVKLIDKVKAIIGGFSPTPQLIKKSEELNLEINHGYGLTESYGPTIFCPPRDPYNNNNNKSLGNSKYDLLARQGIPSLLSGNIKVIDEKGKEVQKDGKSVGEIMLQGNLVMKGYYKDIQATKKAFKHGWFHTGDMAVVDTDGYIKICDRKKDIIISGGENISSLQLENIMLDHPDVEECAVIGRKNSKWGERPFAYIVLKNNVDKSPQTKKIILEYCRLRIAPFKCPDDIIFIEDLPRNSIGKVQKYFLK